MTTPAEIVEAIRGVDARVDMLRDRILAGGDRPLLEGTWTVRDALSHLAARGNGVDRVVQRVRAAQAGTPMTPPATIDEINAGQVEERRDASVEALLDEMRAGHAAAIEAIGHLDQETLDYPLPLPGPSGDLAPAIDLMLRGGPRHDHNHLDQVEAALG